MHGVGTVLWWCWWDQVQKYVFKHSSFRYYIGKSRLSSMDRWFHWRHIAQGRQSSPSAELRRSLWALGWRIRQARCLLLISIVLVDLWQNGSDTSLKPLVMSTELRFCPKGSSVKCTSGGIYALRRLQIKLKHILLHLILIIRRRQIKKHGTHYIYRILQSWTTSHPDNRIKPMQKTQSLNFIPLGVIVKVSKFQNPRNIANALKLYVFRWLSYNMFCCKN